MTEYYFLDDDGDGHWFIVPHMQRESWDAWLNLDFEDPKSWEVPVWAVALQGAPSQVIFVAPKQI